MKLFGAYLKNYWRSGVMFLLFTSIFAVVFALYGLPVQAVGYGALVCALPASAFLALDYLSFRRRHRRLLRLRQALVSAAEDLPAPTGPLEEDYQALVRAMEQERTALAEVMSRRYDDLAEYYTLWAHQIKTPIAAMRLLLQQGDDSPQNRELGDELQRIEQYVEMVLGYLRLESESTDYVIRACELDDIVRPVVRRCASQFIRKKLRLNYEPLNCRVLTDEKWLSFVVEQVLSNALKYTRTGSVSITLEPEKTLCIRDTGIGIAPEDLPRVGEKGYTGYNGRSDKKATGIGLYLCRRILERLGHTIRVESAPGEGTAVRISLASAKLSVE